MPSCDIAVTRKVVQVYRKWILQDKPVFMEEPDKKEVAQEEAEKLGFSETDSKEVIFHPSFQLGLYVFYLLRDPRQVDLFFYHPRYSSCRVPRGPASERLHLCSFQGHRYHLTLRPGPVCIAASLFVITQKLFHTPSYFTHLCTSLKMSLPYC